MVKRTRRNKPDEKAEDVEMFLTTTMRDMKQLLIDAIVGGVHPPIEQCVNLEDRSYMRFTGDQHNPSWSWVRDSLDCLDISELAAIYFEGVLPS